MDARRMAKQVRLTKWAGIMRDQIESGKTKRAWCQENEIEEKTYYYWQRKLREAVCASLEEKQTTGNMLIEGSTVSPMFREVEVSKEAVKQLPAPMGQKEMESVFPVQLSIEVEGIKISTTSVYPEKQLALLLRELVRS